MSSLGFSIYAIKSFANSDSFTSPFPFFIVTFISFSWLITVATTSNTMLNKSGESGHLLLLCDLRKIAYNFSPLTVMLGVGCHI